VVVLVDGFSASASEIVAGSLQDHDRALVVGTTSFGKGLVQTLFQIDGGWALKLTTGKWYTPSGRSIQAEHDRLDDDRFVEYATPADSARADSNRVRPVFRSDAGRQVLGGGGVTPDVVVKGDTATAAERELLRVVGPASQAWYVTLYNLSNTGSRPAHQPRCFPRDPGRNRCRCDPEATASICPGSSGRTREHSPASS
jgi:carboxyl-terminal processing protease